MDGPGGAILAVDFIPNKLIFAGKNPTQFILQDFMLAISARETGICVL